MYSGSLTMEFDGEKIEFNIFDSLRYPIDEPTCFSIDVIDSIAQKFYEVMNEDTLEEAIAQGIGVTNEGKLLKLEEVAAGYDDHIVEVVATLNDYKIFEGKPSSLLNSVSSHKPLPSVVQAPVLERKPLPSHLKYVFLGGNETLPIIVSAALSEVKEDRVKRVVRKYIKAMGWSLADIGGISNTLYVHRILLEEEAKPVRTPTEKTQSANDGDSEKGNHQVTRLWSHLPHLGL